MNNVDVRAIRLAVMASSPGGPVPLSLNVGAEKFAMKITALEAISTAHMLLKSALDSIGPIRAPESDIDLEAPERRVVLATTMLRDALTDLRQATP